MYVFDTFVDNQVAGAALAYSWVLYSVPLIYVSVFVPVLCCLYYDGFVVYFDIKYCDIYSIALFCSGLLWLFRVLCASTSILDVRHIQSIDCFC
jgi:hypothetical protein